MNRLYYVYIMTNQRNGTLYIGMTNNLIRRVFEHKNKVNESFTKRYDLNRLVYFETYRWPIQAIRREKQMKKWHRKWKIKRIVAMNPNWSNLYEQLG